MMVLKREPILFLSSLAMAQCCLAQNVPPPAEMTLAALPLRAVDPIDNPSSPAKVELGRLLFFDPVVSATKSVACATCHHPRHGWADGRATPLGVGGRGIGPERLPVNTAEIDPLPRNTPGLLNVAFNGLVSGQVYDPKKAPMFSDFKLHFIDVTGTGRDDRRPMRTPTLRNLRHTAPYLHHGRMRSLEEVMLFYEKLMDAAAEVLDGGAETDPPIDPLLKQLHLEAEDVEDVLAFLDALNDEGYNKSVPESVPSGLAVGGE